MNNDQYSQIINWQLGSICCRVLRLGTSTGGLGLCQLLPDDAALAPHNVAGAAASFSTLQPQRSVPSREAPAERQLLAHIGGIFRGAATSSAQTSASLHPSRSAPGRQQTSSGGEKNSGLASNLAHLGRIC